MRIHYTKSVPLGPYEIHPVNEPAADVTGSTSAGISKLGFGMTTCPSAPRKEKTAHARSANTVRQHGERTENTDFILVRTQPGTGSMQRLSRFSAQTHVWILS